MPRQAHALDTLLAEVNKHAPRRSKASDGGIGNAEHASRTSDHNPNGRGVWRARDFTHDPGDGFDGQDFADRVAAQLGKHPALGAGAYVIWNRRIISTSRLREGWRKYTGANPHNKHVHVSVATDVRGYDSTRPWNLWASKPTPKPTDTPALRFKAALLAACKDAHADVPKTRKYVHEVRAEVERLAAGIE